MQREFPLIYILQSTACIVVFFHKSLRQIFHNSSNYILREQDGIMRNLKYRNYQKLSLFQSSTMSLYMQQPARENDRVVLRPLNILQNHSCRYYKQLWLSNEINFKEIGINSDGYKTDAKYSTEVQAIFSQNFNMIFGCRPLRFQTSLRSCRLRENQKYVSSPCFAEAYLSLLHQQRKCESFYR